MDLKALQEAIRTIWVLPASALPGGSVYWANQDVPSPAPGPCIEIDLGDLVRIGGPDQVTQEYEPLAAAGQEILFTAAGPREMEVTLQAFSPSADAVQQANDARAVLSRVDAWLALPTIRPVLNAAGLAVIRQGAVRWVPQVHRAGFEGRAVLVTTFMVTETAQARLGYIQTVKGTRKIDAVSNPYTIVIED